jgi:hypothetical protein
LKPRPLFRRPGTQPMVEAFSAPLPDYPDCGAWLEVPPGCSTPPSDSRPGSSRSRGRPYASRPTSETEKDTKIATVRHFLITCCMNVTFLLAASQKKLPHERRVRDASPPEGRQVCSTRCERELEWMDTRGPLPRVEPSHQRIGWPKASRLSLTRLGVRPSTTAPRGSPDETRRFFFFRNNIIGAESKVNANCSYTLAILGRQTRQRMFETLGKGTV